MTTDLDELIQAFYEYFLGLYHQAATAAPSTGEAFLAFEPIGTAITPAMFQLPTAGQDYSPVLEVEQFSKLANTLPLITGTTIQSPSIWTVDGLYETLLFGAAPLAQTDLGLFGMLKSEALMDFDRAKREPLLGAHQFRPADATPKDWCEPAAAANWLSRSFSKTQTTEAGSSAGPVPQPPRVVPPIQRWDWRVVPQDLTPVLNSPDLMRQMVPVQKLEIAPNLAGSMTRTQFAAMSPVAARAMVAMPVSAVAASVSTVEEPIKPLKLVPRPQVEAEYAQQLVGTASRQSVTSTSLSLSFDYCLVTATRPWLCAAFLSTKGWYLQGRKAGEYASGTGTGSGLLEVIPTAALVVKNLTISASWSDEEMVTATSSAALGPFSLVGREIDQVSNVITCKGMQIVAWICEPMPLLPPDSDPALP
jgi:hypothetical protein